MAVTFTSAFYDGPNTETQRAEGWIGPSYGVRGAGDWKVTAVAGQDRTVSIALGAGFGHGVTDETVANDTIQLDIPPAGGSRWDLIAVRRDWQPAAGGPTQFVKVNGSATKAIPAGRLNNPGVQDDQPLALVQVTSGQSQPTAIVDLRCWSSNTGTVAADELAKTYLNQPGSRVLINGVDWAFLPDANGTFAWVDVHAAPADIALWFGNGSGAYGSQPAPVIKKLGSGYVRVEGVFRPGTSADGSSLLSIPTGNRAVHSPAVTQNKKVAYRTTSSTYGVAFAQVTSSGTMLFYGLPSNTDYVELGFGWFV